MCHQWWLPPKEIKFRRFIPVKLLVDGFKVELEVQLGHDETHFCQRQSGFAATIRQPALPNALVKLDLGPDHLLFADTGSRPHAERL